MKRFVAVALFGLRISIAAASLEEDSSPLAIVVARPGSSVQDERTLLGNTRLDEVSRAAAARGIRAGSTIAAARARDASLRVRVVEAHAVDATLAGLAEACLTFGATTSFQAAPGRDTVWIDVTGCAHLHASSRDPSGEQVLLTRILARVEELGFTARVAIADGPHLAEAVARHGLGTDVRSRARCLLLPSGELGARMLGQLPLRALPVDEDTRRWLRSLGMRTVGDVRVLPRHALGSRLEGQAPGVFAILDGRDPSPLVPYRPPERPEERIELEYGATESSALLFVSKRLCDRLEARLDGRAMAAARLELVFELDRALVEEGPPRREIELTLAAPLYAGLFDVLRTRIEREEVSAPVRAVVLRCTELVPRSASPQHLFDPEARAERALERLVPELVVDLGEPCVGILELRSSWLPEERGQLVPYRVGRRAPDVVRDGLPSIEPTRLVHLPAGGPFLLELSLEPLQPLARFEGVQWWKAGPRVWQLGATWSERMQSFALVEREQGRALRLRGWVD